MTTEMIRVTNMIENKKIEKKNKKIMKDLADKMMKMKV